MPITANNLHKSTPVPWVFNEEGVDCDFRVESDTNSHALFVDAGNSRIGVNNSAPAVALDVTGAVKASTTITAGTGLTVTSGIANFNASGMRTMQAVNNVHDTAPTAAELTTSFGAAATLGRGFVGTVDDNDGDTNCYLVWVSDASFFFLKGTKAS